MRVTEDRYDRDRLKLDLARRMIRHEARTCTIRAATHLTEDRIRKLFRRYVEPAAGPVRRRRGKPPAQVAFFTRSAAIQLDASLMASILLSYGLLNSRSRPGDDAATVELGQLFCDAFETYANFRPEGLLTFEHGWLLLQALEAGRELRFARCVRCAAQYVRDPLSLDRNRCPACRLKLARLRSGESRTQTCERDHRC